jgi:riboflavin kinase/FMN adenylyltransferase
LAWQKSLLRIKQEFRSAKLAINREIDKIACSMSNELIRVNNIDQVDQRTPTFLAIGVFDGVHNGHQQLLENMVAASKAAGVRSAVLTFYPHPGNVIEGRSGRLYLCPLEERVHLLAKLGLDLIITQTFNETFRRTRAAEFIDQLRQDVGLDQLWGGTFGLGYQREGDLSFLKAQGIEKGFTVFRYKAFTEWQGRLVSSSRIRRSLIEGDVGDATGCLGRPYRIAGTVIHGDGRGHELGIPTANLKIWDEQILPANGVYAAWASIGPERYKAAVNVGYRPTVNGHSLNIEAHLLDFNREIYGQELVLEFYGRIRDEQKFDNLNSLVDQIHRDIDQVNHVLATAPVSNQQQS